MEDRPKETEGSIPACSLASGDSPGRCTLCGVELPKRRQRWCSDEHGLTYYQNHSWSFARKKALELGHRRCAKCGGTHRLTDAELWFISFLRWWCPPISRQTSNESLLDWFDRTDADENAKRWAAVWKMESKLLHRRSLEVNHKVPILGKHSQRGCWHHQENLEVLCRSCHLVETSKQRADGLFKKG